jgi:cardiolipin synthase
LNFELDVEVYHSELVLQLNELISNQQGRQVTAATLGQRSLAVRLRDSAARLMLPYL